MPTDGKARVQFIHASPDAPAVDVLVNGTAEVRDLRFGHESASLMLDPGTIDIGVVATGTAEPLVIDVKGFEVKANEIYTIVAMGDLANIQPLVLMTTPHSIR